MASELEAPRNQREIILFGMKRTGNHGIITWINHLFDEPVYFINNVRHFTDPFSKNHEFRRHKNMNCVDLHKKRFPDDVFSTQIREEPKSTLLLSYEDVDLRKLSDTPIIAGKAVKIGDSRIETTVLLLRDHYNIIASRMQMYQREGSAVSLERMQRDLDLWKAYAKEFTGQTQCLPDDTIRISYNDWFSSEPYRRGLADQLNLPFSDDGLEVMPPQGSSFDANTMDGQTQKMKVLDRWRNFWDNEVFQQIARDEEAIDLTAQIFDFRPI